MPQGAVKTNIGIGQDNGGDYADAVAVQPDGKIVVGGHTAPVFYNDFLLVRYKSDGSLDTSFDTDGIVTTAIGSGNDIARDIAIQSDGSIIATGFTTTPSGSRDFALTRYCA